MKLVGLILLSFFVGQTGAPVPIHTVYDKVSDITEIKTNWLYVSNAPDQFLQLKLVGRVKGRSKSKPGMDELQIEVISHALRPRYSAQPELVAIADGTEIRIGKMSAHPNPAIMNRVGPVPPSAAVLASHKIEDLKGEWIVTNVSWETLTALAQASRIEWRLGEDAFSFIDIQVTRLKQFVAAVTSESVVATAEEATLADRPLRTDTPSDTNNSSLKDTLNWLKQQINKYAAVGTSRYGDSMTLTLTNFNSCNIEWRLAPQSVNPVVPGWQRKYPPLSQYYKAALGDLEPGSVEVTESGNSLQFSTRKREQRISLGYRDDATGQINGFMSERLNYASFELKKNDLGPEMREAMSHAIKLCQKDK